jgi:hypothetical protein
MRGVKYIFFFSFLASICYSLFYYDDIDPIVVVSCISMILAAILELRRDRSVDESFVSRIATCETKIEFIEKFCLSDRGKDE